MTLLEFRNNDESEWGRSRVENSLLDRLILRRRDRARREQFLQENRERRLRDDKGRYVKPASEPVKGEVFVSESGILAYVSAIATIQNGISVSAFELRKTHVSLPYVSILFTGNEPARSA